MIGWRRHPDGAGVRDDAAPMLTVENLQVRYANDALGVNGVSLSVERGRVAALLGPNGAGKTTTVRAIGGFLRSEGARVTRGSVRLEGRDVTRFEPFATSALGVALVPERDKIFPTMSVRENLLALVGLPGRGTDRDEALESVYELFPILRKRSKQPAGLLSGGQQQMLAIARALLQKPKLLVLDEITLGLHHSLHAPLYDVVERISADGVAVLIVDESVGFALEAAHYCYILNAGVVADEGPPEKYKGNELLAAGYLS
jgi:branched-chain amino acid transport system ATP-binding protein